MPDISAASNLSKTAEADRLKVQLTGRINRCGAITPRFSVQLDEMEYWEKQYLPGQELRAPDTFDLAWCNFPRTGEERRHWRRIAGVRLLKVRIMSAVRKVKIPDGVKAHLDGTQLRVTGPKGQLSRNMRFPQVTVTCDDKEVIISTESKRKEITSMVGTLEAHTKNMCRGVTEGFEYRMKVVYSHFPIQLKLQGNKLEIANFLGEKKARYARIEQGVTAKVANDEVVLTGIDRELVGTSAANIEHATHIRNRDPRVFQDGVYMVQRG